MQIREITSCRICGSEDLISILSLGTHYVSNFVDSKEEGVKAPLELVLCDVNNGGCGLLQLKHTIPGQILYRNYWYKSGTNESMRQALKDIVDKAEQLVKLNTGDIVLDIGCNDGTLLRAYKTKNINAIGFEPATNLITEAEVATTKIINDFFGYEEFRKVSSGKKAKVITSIAMFYDLDDPNTFVAGVVKCLDDNGVWIIEMHYLPLTLEKNAFDAICHEHLEYYSVLALKNLLERHHLEIFDVELNAINGGSIRTYIKHKHAKSIKPFGGAKERLQYLEEYEEKLGLSSRQVYDEFTKRIDKIKKELTTFIKKEVDTGKSVYVYGASTKGNTLLQYFGLDSNVIKAAAERNPNKWGKMTIGTWIPIISEEQARAEKPDYFLVLPWHFLESFKERERDFLESGGKFIVPLPEFKIIDSSKK